MSFLSKELFYYKGTNFNEVVLDISEVSISDFGNSDYFFRAQIRPSRKSSTVYVDITNNYFERYTSEGSSVVDKLKIVAPGDIFESIPDGKVAMDIFLFDNSVFPQRRELMSYYDLDVRQNVTQVGYNPAVVPALTLQVDTTIQGQTDDTSFKLAGAVGTYDAEVYKDGFIVETQESLSGDQTIGFASAGIYDVRIIPKGATPFHRIALGTSADNKKVVKLKEWGPAKYSSMSNAFAGCSNMEVVASDNPDIGDVTSMADAFKGVTAFNIDLSGWNFTNVVDFDGMLKDTSYNRDISWLNNGMPKSVKNLFENTPLAQDISVIDIADISAIDNAFDNTSLTEAQYDKAVIKWANDIYEGSLTVPALNIGALNLKYSDSVYWDDFYEKEYVKTVEARYYLEQTHNWTFVGDTADLLIDVHGANINVLFSGNLHNTALLGQDFVEVERASDNTTQIFQATVRGFDKNAIEAFCAGSQGFIRWIPNQGGNAAYDSTFGASDVKPYITDSNGKLNTENEIHGNNCQWQVGTGLITINERNTSKLFIGSFQKGATSGTSVSYRSDSDGVYAYRNTIASGNNDPYVEFKEEGAWNSPNEKIQFDESEFDYLDNVIFPEFNNVYLYGIQDSNAIIKINDLDIVGKPITPTVATSRQVNEYVLYESNSKIKLFVQFDTTEGLEAGLYDYVLNSQRLLFLENALESPITVVDDTAPNGSGLANTGLSYDEENEKLIVAQFNGSGGDFTGIKIVDRSSFQTESLILIDYAFANQDIWKIGDIFYVKSGAAYNQDGSRNETEDLNLAPLPSSNGDNQTNYSLDHLWRYIGSNEYIKVDPESMTVVATYSGAHSTEGFYVSRNFVVTSINSTMAVFDRATKQMITMIPTSEPEGTAIDADENFYINRDEFFHGGIVGGNRLWKYNSRKIGF